MLTKEFLQQVAKYEQNPQYREMARELLEIRAKDKLVEKDVSSEAVPYNVCDDCDMTYPCCKKCVGA
jgi:hypothetical protein